MTDKIRLMVVSTAENTDAILNQLILLQPDSVEIALHFGSKYSDIKASSYSRMVKRGTKKAPNHLMRDSVFFGGAHEVIDCLDFSENFAQFTEHLHRDGSSAKIRSHSLHYIHDYYDYYHILLDHFSELLETNEISHALFFNVPHLTYDTVLYQLAKSKNIPITIVSQSLIPNKFFSLRDIDSVGSIKFSGVIEQKKRLERAPEKLFYMKNIGQGEGKKGKLSIRGIMNIVLHCWLKRPALLINPFALIQLLIKANRYSKKFPDWRDPFAKFFNDNSFEYLEHLLEFENKKVDLSKKFVYFPLHLQPEMTTSSLGMIYRDQALAIERLAEILPNDIKIYVKENPKQGAYARGALFFYRLKRIPQVEFLPSYIDTHELQNRCEFLATITGTAGWECIKQGKKVVLFGNAWYKSLPGVIQFKQSLLFADIEKYKFEHSELEIAYSELLENMHDGVVDRHYSGMVNDFSKEENNKLVAQTLLNLISHKAKTTFSATAGKSRL